MKVLALATLAACATAPGQPIAVVTRGDLVVTVVATGELAAVDATDVEPPAITSMYDFKIATLAPEGSVVAVGDPLVSFDTTDLDRQIQQSQSELESAEKRLDKRRQEIVVQRGNDDVRVLEADANARKTALKREAPPELSSAIQVREAQLEDEVARMLLDETKRSVAYQRNADDTDVANTAIYLASTKARVEQLQADLARLHVMSPRAGTVVYVVGWGGDKKTVGSESYRGSPCVQVVGLDHMAGNAEVDEVDLPHVAERQPVTLRLDAMPDLALQGSVADIASSVQPHSMDDPSNVARVTFAIDRTDAALRPGMRFRADIETARVADVVQVPASAVAITADGPVAELADGARVPLVLGRRSRDAIEVVSGLSAGDEVVDVGASR